MATTQNEAESPQNKYPLFVSLGMLVLDELRFPHLDTVADVPGGSGFYGTSPPLLLLSPDMETNDEQPPATLGARLFKPSPKSKDVGCIIMAGHDFPASVGDLLQSWQINLLLVREADKQCTRGLLEYENDAFSRT